MPTDEEIVERVEKLLAGPSIQQQVTKLLAEQMKAFIGQPMTKMLEGELHSRATQGIRQILNDVAPEFITNKFGIELVRDGPDGITVRVTMELP